MGVDAAGIGKEYPGGKGWNRLEGRCGRWRYDLLSRAKDASYMKDIKDGEGQMRPSRAFRE